MVLCYGMLFISTIKGGIERRGQIEKINTPDALWFGKTEEMGNPFSYPSVCTVDGMAWEESACLVSARRGLLASAACVCVSRCLGIWRSPPYHQEIERSLLNYFSKLDSRGPSLPGPCLTTGFRSSLHHQLVLCLVPWPQVSGDN